MVNTSALFTDDVAVIPEKEEDLQRNLEHLARSPTKWKLRMTVERTKVMEVARVARGCKEQY